MPMAVPMERSNSPHEQGLALIEDWSRPARFWLAWPSAGELTSEQADDLNEACAALARLLARYAPVTMLANPAEAASLSLRLGAGIGTMIAAHSESCLRHGGPSFLGDAQGRLAAGLDWATGPLARHVLDHLRLPVFNAPRGLRDILVDQDGAGSGLADESRIGDMDRATAERLLMEFCGLRHVVWLRGGLVGDGPASGPNLARFLANGVVAVAVSNRPNTADSEITAENLHRLRTARDAADRALHIVQFPLAMPRRSGNGLYRALSYTNCLAMPDGIILPAFEDSCDDRSYYALADALPGMPITVLDALPLALSGGGLAASVISQPAG